MVRRRGAGGKDFSAHRTDDSASISLQKIEAKMIGTHSSKIFNARVQQPGVRATLAPQPPGLLCSSSVEMEKRFWAIPENAADMRRFIDERNSLNLAADIA